MLRSRCANRALSTRSCKNQLHVEVLEDRRLLSVNTHTIVEPPHIDGDMNETRVSDSGELSLQTPISLVSVSQLIIGSKKTEPIDGGFQPSLAVPPDDSIDPLVECPGIEPEFCLPGDADLDYDVDFQDFLILSNNYGLTNAGWVDGDFDGDAEVGFSDLVILNNNFGLSVAPPSGATSAFSIDAVDPGFRDDDLDNRESPLRRIRGLFAHRPDTEAEAVRPGGFAGRRP